MPESFDIDHRKPLWAYACKVASFTTAISVLVVAFTQPAYMFQLVVLIMSALAGWR